MLLMAQEAAAQRGASAQAMLEEVVVTARRREENLQDLPLSIAAISADAMLAQGIYSIEDIADFVPNVTLTQSDRASNTRVVIRGIGGGHPDPAFVFGAGMYIDGHYIPNSLGGYMSTMDIERVELLRGPQGTLFGKNVTGGAVNIISAKPGPEFDSSVTLRAAEDGDNDFRGMVNFPISENVFARVGFAKEVFDGYYYNKHLGIDTGGEDHTSFNGALRWTPGNWTIDLNAFLIKMRDDNKGGQCNIGPPGSQEENQWGGGTGHLERVYVGFSDDYYGQCDPSNPDSGVADGVFVNTSDKITFADIDQEVVMASAQWDSPGPVGGLEALSVKISGSYRYNDYDYLQDRDYQLYTIDAIGEVAVDTLGPGFGSIGQDNWTRGAELLVEGTVNDRLDFTTGINYFYEKAKNGDGRCRTLFENSEFSNSIPNPAFQAWLDGGQVGDPPLAISPAVGTGDEGFYCDRPSGLYFELLPFPRVNAGGPGPFLNSARIENESIGVFGHLTYALNDNWDLDFGARWTEDDREFWNMESATEDCIAESGPDGTGPQSERVLGDPSTTGRTGICDVNYFMSWNNVINAGYFNSAADTFSEVTPMISLTRNLAGGDTLDSGMIYFLYSEGFLTGGFNPEVNSNVPAVATLLSYEPEHVKNYEVGFKGTLADGRVRIMADVFIMDYTDKQDSINIDNPDGAYGIDDPLGVVQNVSSVEIAGVEFELRASLWDGGFISVDLGVLDNEYGEYRYADPETGVGFIDETNSSISDLTADYTLNIGIEHEFALGNGGTLTPRLNVYSQDDYDYNAASRDAPPSFCNQDGYTKVGARLTYVPPAGNWQASLYGQNITDEEIYENCGDSRGVFTYRHERPAYWGLEFQARWGAGAN
jgi:iron complex outermembrane receptor protein